jgi:hypothetical protein
MKKIPQLGDYSNQGCLKKYQFIFYMNSVKVSITSNHFAHINTAQLPTPQSIHNIIIQIYLVLLIFFNRYESTRICLI